MPKKSFSKYHSKKVVVDGIEFDSRKESERFLVLKARERIGEITNLQLQVPFLLIPSQHETVIGYTKTGKEKTYNKLIERKVIYIADFVYECNGEVIVEDVKGYRSGQAYQIYKLKRKLMLWRHGIKIQEV